MSNSPDDRASPSGGRETFLALMLVCLVGGGFILFLNFATFGFFGYVLVICAGLGLLGCLHYLLWGHRFNHDVEQERRALDAQRRAEEESQQRPWERRF